QAGVGLLPPGGDLLLPAGLGLDDGPQLREEFGEAGVLKRAGDEQVAARGGRGRQGDAGLQDFDGRAEAARALHGVPPPLPAAPCSGYECTSERAGKQVSAPRTKTPPAPWGWAGGVAKEPGHTAPALQV